MSIRLGLPQKTHDCEVKAIAKSKDSDYFAPMRSVVLTFLVIFSVFAQGFAGYADTSPATAMDHPIASELMDHNTTTANAEACCTENQAENTIPTCNGGDCKLFFADYSTGEISPSDVHSTFLVVEEFSFQNVVRLRPPNA